MTPVAMDEPTTKAVVLAACTEIQAAARELSGLAEGASSCGAAGNAAGAVQILLDLEPKLGRIQRLLDLVPTPVGQHRSWPGVPTPVRLNFPGRQKFKLPSPTPAFEGRPVVLTTQAEGG